MEIEALTALVPTEHRAIYVVGELHHYPVNAPIMERLFRDHGWTLEFFDTGDLTSGFRACSPAAVPLLNWATSVKVYLNLFDVPRQRFAYNNLRRRVSRHGTQREKSKGTSVIA
jgi:hypothetical protein